MFEAEEDGAITQMELAVILKTALGVTHLSVSHLFTAIDAGNIGKITFGKRLNKMNHPWSFFLMESLFWTFLVHHNSSGLCWLFLPKNENQATLSSAVHLCLGIFVSRYLCLWRPLVVFPQTSSEALWSSTQTLLRTICTQKTQASTAVPLPVTKQSPTCLPLTCKALPP